MVIPNFVRQALDGDPITVFGDGKQSRCFTDVSDVVGALVGLKVDLRVVHLYDSREWGLDYRGASRFRSPEGGPPLVVDPAGAQRELDAVVAEYLSEVNSYLGAQRGHHVLAPTDRVLDRVLADLLGGV